MGVGKTRSRPLGWPSSCLAPEGICWAQRPRSCPACAAETSDRAGSRPAPSLLPHSPLPPPPNRDEKRSKPLVRRNLRLAGCGLRRRQFAQGRCGSAPWLATERRPIFPIATPPGGSARGARLAPRCRVGLGRLSQARACNFFSERRFADARARAQSHRVLADRALFAELVSAGLWIYSK